MTAPRRAAAVAAAILALTVAAGCADDDTAGTASTATPTATAPAGDQRLADPAAGAMLAGPSAPNVADLLADTTGEPVVGAGYLFVDPDGAARLCEAIAESFPPQCGPPSIPVTNLPPELVDGLASKDGLRWSDEPVQLIGRVTDGTFVNDPELLAAS
jgi:hypothetical protein